MLDTLWSLKHKVVVYHFACLEAVTCTAYGSFIYSVKPALDIMPWYPDRQNRADPPNISLREYSHGSCFPSLFRKCNYRCGFKKALSFFWILFLPKEFRYYHARCWAVLQTEPSESVRFLQSDGHGGFLQRPTKIKGALFWIFRVAVFTKAQGQVNKIVFFSWNDPILSPMYAKTDFSESKFLIANLCFSENMAQRYIFHMS